MFKAIFMVVRGLLGDGDGKGVGIVRGCRLSDRNSNIMVHCKCHADRTVTAVLNLVITPEMRVARFTSTL